MTTTTNRVLEDLIRNEWPKLRRFFRTKVADADVLDLVQQTMLAFVEGRSRATSGERAYLWGIARFQVLKHYEKHRASTPFDSTLHTAMELGPSLSSRLDGRTRLLRALHTLPVDHQMAFELRHGEELPLEEVAAAIGYQGGKDTGRFMKEWMAKYKGLADGKLVQDALKTLG